MTHRPPNQRSAHNTISLPLCRLYLLFIINGHVVVKFEILLGAIGNGGSEIKLHRYGGPDCGIKNKIFPHIGALRRSVYLNTRAGDVRPSTCTGTYRVYLRFLLMPIGRRDWQSQILLYPADMA